MAKAKILIAKPGLDGHDRGAMIIAHALRDAGFEVIYTGIRQTPEQIVAAAVEEDVDIIGLSCLSGAHLELFGRVTELLRQKDLADTAVVGGGIIPEEDIPRLREMGIKKVFTPGASTTEIVTYFNNLLGEN
ncbi:MAG: cobalamin B12-binding domain-containing protein [Candidatus Tritonobacter lacicola]|nr:cobalamin B12-binding domain-containing protein [Candidatus Tritonobacter lacicola]